MSTLSSLKFSVNYKERNFLYWDFMICKRRRITHKFNIKPQGLYVKFVSDLSAVLHRENPQKGNSRLIILTLNVSIGDNGNPR